MISKKKEKNIIIAQIKNEKENINKKIKIINSFEQSVRDHSLNYFGIKNEEKYKYENEEEIKDNCKIIINNKTIEFSYFYEFQEEGIYKIEYLFINNITKTDFMFHECKNLTNINLLNFNTQNVIKMRSMYVQ